MVAIKNKGEFFSLYSSLNLGYLEFDWFKPGRFWVLRQRITKKTPMEVTKGVFFDKDFNRR
ncbi:hypothetical protein P872_15395 [Rhodonellum psychrophilum GCM71 = DSM 17998]|uniref:Uncharacterized protein n=1 Tax=Rhodonellum psychrophilum GCM71 = DSM 17998 TaxID=1123057 RepID=U5C5F8_9BACT|nr:hypothetical protein P872_15395 [Rhodonellum psychrophilum GCM71 = DSM 17998]